MLADLNIKAVFFDLFETLVDLEVLSHSMFVKSLFESITQGGLKVDFPELKKTYEYVHNKYRQLRYSSHKEFGNNVWISETLSSLGHVFDPEHSLILKIVEGQFKPFENRIHLINGAKDVLNIASKKYKVGLITNFTHAPFVHSILRRNNLDQYFNIKLISHEERIRKPHPQIFKTAINRLGVTAKEAVMVGDNPYDDIYGASLLGLTTIWIPTSKQKALINDIKEDHLPDFIVPDLKSLINI